MWQGEYCDLVFGSIPLDLVLPALSEEGYRSADQALRVSFGGGISADLSVDVWLDIDEEVVRDEY
jgi:hypothetical protein